MKNKVPAIFFDRDGTLNVDYGYVHTIDNFQFIHGTLDALLTLKKMNFALVLVTNQSGIARNLFTESQFLSLTAWMYRSLAHCDIILDGIYYCPHLPEAKLEIYRQKCECRKPKPGMLIAAQRHLNTDMTASYMVGDTLEDMQAAKMACIGTKVLVKSGQPITNKAKRAADWIINSLADLPENIKKKSFDKWKN
ncbi:D-glycero-beta-D-manno-heptose 1,7-bisphosphate 7-phosphatase [Candidatus Pantoea carbekii]|uniref:D,D-heptose 1,7-bisphosphate phosphatase n=1 Tax=Candidatus Pantoea carbekii TaxID=1235990 RepID=U3U652_9GAMM|nr:D-glycero-beta-D-manno-heptose 1,7-bisphosphate 7-phosphatase [Candidatus Pantoea carbekii]AKC31885.1 D,D-heptose 1,7-bisphosphate phosphatase [Candidatus Pantoea carbekii]BAO00400.1 D,D-heptose 1,7-bisphosphate phosphatase [Candidatus Pantoea carbekii]